MTDNGAASNGHAGSSAVSGASGSVSSGKVDGAAVEAALTALEVDFRAEGDDAFLVTLPGERRYRTLVWVIVGTHELLIESFVCRRPDENADGVHSFLLRRNTRLRTVAYALDADGDIHLVGRLGLSAMTPQTLEAELDTVLGVLLSTADEDFNQILERGFAEAIRREWAWRTSRGQSVKNLEAFRHLV
ncbi:YbjN domain-containing protein [Nakamurella sp. YIM 132087]|uniref:YbjN domain-containing protein n=1 Tax=Nakamurella alba TaxID=2665158 RepID=A0A7K1FPT0_9ACTN|nr:YbjN domain-containing protein [Nakamurella alba]MTD16152.1 YbjN domain-containing protein [Nakamurella alba]